MSKFCLKCGAENRDNAQFCEKCGYKWEDNTNAQTSGSNGIIDKLFYKIDKKTGQSRVSKGKTIIILIIILFLLLIVVSSFSNPTPETTIQVTDLSIVSEGYGMYSVTGNIIPDKDYSYLELVVVFYDDTGAVLDRAPLVWNMNDIHQNQTIRMDGTAYVSSDSAPATAEVYFFDSAFSGDDVSDSIYNQTIEM